MVERLTSLALKFWNVLKAPVFEDEERTRLARLQNAMLIPITIWAATMAVAAIFIDLENWERLYFILPILIVVPLLRLILNTGRVYTTGYLLASLVWAVLTVATYTGGGLDSVAYSIYIISIMLAVLVAGNRFGFFITGLTLLVGLSYVIFDSRELLEPVVWSPISLWLVYALVLTVGALILAVSNQSSRNAIRRAQQSEAVLANRNILLETQAADLNRANRAYRLLSACNHVVVRASDTKMLVEQICDIIVNIGGYETAWIGFTRPSEPTAVDVITRSGQMRSADSLTENANQLRSSTYALVETAIKSGVPQVIKQIGLPIGEPTSDRPAPTRQEMSTICAPLMVNNRPIGVLTIYTEDPQAFDTEEINLLMEMANNLAYSIGTLQMRDDHNKAQLEADFQRTLLERHLEADLDAVLIVSNEREWLYYNQRFLEMWDINEVVLYTSSPEAQADHFKSYVQDGDRFYQEIDEIYDQPFGIDRREVIFKDGRVFDRFSAPVVSDSGVYFGRQWSYRDLTQQKELEEQLQLSRRMEAVGQLTAGIAHDFNNQLTAINISAEILQNRLDAGDRNRKKVDRILDAGHRAARLIRQLMAFSRHDIIQPRVLEINEVLQQFQKFLDTIIGEHIRLETELGPQVWSIHIDPSQLEQVIVNIVVNARDAMSKGGTLSIKTDNVVLPEAEEARIVHPDGLECVRMTISDTGVGMSKSVQSRIFEPFFTTKAIGKGTGLGLSTVYGIIQQAGGDIRVESEVGKGTTFEIFIPRTQETVRVEMPVPPATAVNESQGERILLVEDADEVRELVADILSTQGYQVVEACNGMDALEVHAQTSDEFQLLITDIVMPVLSGDQLAAQLTLKQPNLKILYISGYTPDAIHRFSNLKQGIALLPKPFNPNALIRKVREILDA